MKNKDLDQIHEAAVILRQTIEKFIGKKAIVYWAGIDAIPEVSSGLTVSDEVSNRDLEHVSFCLIGRAYNMVDYDEKDNR